MIDTHIDESTTFYCTKTQRNRKSVRKILIRKELCKWRPYDNYAVSSRQPLDGVVHEI